MGRNPNKGHERSTNGSRWGDPRRNFNFTNRTKIL